MWKKGKEIDNATSIGEQEEGLYKLKGQPEQELVHESISNQMNYGTKYLHMCTIEHYQWK